MRELLGTIVVMVSLVGCATPGTSAVRVRAASDLSCASDDVQVQYEGNHHWTAMGCGKQARYRCHSEDDSPVKPFTCEPMPLGE